jgi:hypothetical protein
MPPAARPPFLKQLVLTRHFARSLGLSYDVLLTRLSQTAPGIGADGATQFFHALAGVVGTSIDRDALRRYDTRLIAHEAHIGRRRASEGRVFRLTYFQYLACLAVEWYLDRFSQDAAKLMAELEAARVDLAPHLPAYTTPDIAKLAVFMSIGAGKTLVMHINLLQFLHYRPLGREPNSILLITPNEELSHQHRRELELSDLLNLNIEVREITKFFVTGEGAKPKGGESLAVDQFGGPNLLLVDEGHKGTKSDNTTERAWRNIREALAGHDDRFSIKPGFTFEYSATFAQIAALDGDLSDEYAKSTIVEFAYGRFWRDGYGKDFRVLNTRANDESADLVMAAGLLAFYQQTRWFDEHRADAHEYRVETPLMVFLGSKVQAKDSEVMRTVTFLDRAGRDTPWLARLIEKVLTIGGVQQTFAGDPLDFEMVRSLGLGSTELAADVAARVFGGKGGFLAIRVNENEIGLRSKGAPADHYFGVINVGNARDVHTTLLETGIADGGEDRLTDSLFKSIDRRAEIKVLIGAKRFIEGWSSWRVAAMGLINVGRGEGSQIVQMFGRGVRLLGKCGDLRRSSANARAGVPRGLELLERLMVFGVRADYMTAFLESLEREGAGRTILEAPVDCSFDFAGAKLLTLHSQGDFKDEVVAFSAAAARAQQVVIESHLTVTVGLGQSQSLGQDNNVVHGLALAEADFEKLVLDMYALKSANGWRNLWLSTTQLREFVDKMATLRASADYFSGPDARQRRYAAARECLTNAVSQFYRGEERRFLSARLTTRELTSHDGNMPWIADGQGSSRLAYRLEIEAANEVVAAALANLKRDMGSRLAPDTFERIRYVIANNVGLDNVAAEIAAVFESGNFAVKNDDLSAPIPRLFAPEHVYAPLLISRPARIDKGQLDFDFDAPTLGFRSQPPMLVESEAHFVWHLREFWKSNANKAPFKECNLYLLRNLPHRGVGFFRTEGFFPDFLLWLKRGKKQALAFVEPKGILLNWPQDKLDMLAQLRDIKLSLPLRGFLVSQTPFADLAKHHAGTTQESMQKAGIVFAHDPDFAGHILKELRATL